MNGSRCTCRLDLNRSLDEGRLAPRSQVGSHAAEFRPPTAAHGTAPPRAGCQPPSTKGALGGPTAYAVDVAGTAGTKPLGGVPHLVKTLFWGPDRDVEVLGAALRSAQWVPCRSPQTSEY